jgi:hypothetical protein
MDYIFTSHIMVDGARIAPISGIAVLIENPLALTVCGRYPDWTVAEIKVDGVRVPDAGTPVKCRVDMPDDHWLHDRLLADLLNRHRRDIDQLWRARMDTPSRRGRLALVSGQ